MRTILVPKITVTGANGTATGDSGSVGVGDVSRIHAVQPIYDGAAPATTVFTVSSGGRTVATTPASNTPRQYPVLEQAYDTAGVAIAAGQSPRYVPPVVNGTIDVVVTAANAGTGYGLIVYLLD